jgi:PAS domain-containing protein
MRLEGSRLGAGMDGLCHVVMLDITGYKQTGELLKLSEARYQAIIESQNDLICRFCPMAPSPSSTSILSLFWLLL